MEHAQQKAAQGSMAGIVAEGIWDSARFRRLQHCLLVEEEEKLEERQILSVWAVEKPCMRSGCPPEVQSAAEVAIEVGAQVSRTQY